MKEIFCVLISWVVVAFGQPAWIPAFAPLAAAFGYALFWIGIAKWPLKTRVLLAVVWFFCVQLIQLSWMTSIQYQGIYILFVYAGLCLWLGAQFSLLTYALGNPAELRFKKILALASLWTLLEWSRLFVFCGFTWNPVGLALTAYLPSLQFASIWGIYGLSFWVMLVNLFAVALRNRVTWASLALLPTCFGILYLHCLSKDPTAKSLTAALVQTGLLPSQKVPLPGRYGDFIPPLEQCDAIFRALAEKKTLSWDLIALPEAAVPLSMDQMVYPRDEMLAVIARRFGNPALAHVPPLKSPFAALRDSNWYVSNAFWVQFLANHFGAEVVIGLDHIERDSQKSYNAAFHWEPYAEDLSARYDKQILLPLAEYLPWEWLKQLTKNYGIVYFFTPGTQPSVIGKKARFSLSICYEETFAALMRRGKVQGAECFINLTNDNYYPHSRLAKQHFDHARVRAVENGVPLLRACNTGVTAAVDRTGSPIALLQEGGKPAECSLGVLDVSLRLETHPTLYEFWGDAGIVCICVICCAMEGLFFKNYFFRFRRRVQNVLEE